MNHIDFSNISFQTYIEGRIKAAIFNQANVHVDMAYDCEDCDRAMRERDNRAFTIQQHMEGIVHMAIDGLIDLDVESDGILKFDRDKMLALAKQIANEDKMAAFLAQVGLMMQGYKISPTTHKMLVEQMGILYSDV